MKIRVSKQYGTANIVLELEAADTKEALLKASIFTIADRCVLCKQTEIGLEGSQTADGIIYIKRKCRACTATSTLGSYKNGKGYFWKSWEKYDLDKKKNPNGTYAPVETLTDDDL